MTEDYKIKIAIIDDDEDDFYFLNEFINSIEGKEFVVDWFRDYNSALEQMRSRAYDLYFVDYFLGVHTGLDLIHQESDIPFERPVILLTGIGSKEIDMKAMKSGATDYLVKSELNAEKVERWIRYALERSGFMKELKTREMRYKQLFEGSKDAVFIADTSLRFKEVNHAAQLLLEKDSGTLATHTLYDFIDDPVHKARIKDIVATGGKIDDLEINLKRHNGDINNCLLSLYVLRQTENDLVVHGILHNITNIRKAELANLETQKLEANEKLMRTLAHEIRNPLNNIILSVEHLNASDLDPEVNEYLQIIQRNALRINQIIKELLCLAAPSHMEFEQCSLQEIMEESLSRAHDRILLNGVQVNKNFPETPLSVWADKNNLAIAFTNILINAIEAMEEGKGKLSVSLVNDGDSYTFSIKDNGRGIPKEFVSKLFEPFFTLKKKGMGLGLTASWTIIQSHKAKMQVESEEGEGTNFLITFNKKNWLHTPELKEKYMNNTAPANQ